MCYEPMTTFFEGNSCSFKSKTDISVIECKLYRYTMDILDLLILAKNTLFDILINC